MAEGLVGVVQNVLIGPWYGGVYDLLLTDRRFLLIFIEKFGMKTKMEPRSPEGYARESADVLASRERSSSVLYSAVKTIRQKVESSSQWRMLLIEYESRDGRIRTLKLMLVPQENPKLHMLTVSGSRATLSPVMADDETGMEILLSKAMPGIAL